MSSLPLSRSSSPSLQSVTDISDIGSVSSVAPTNTDGHTTIAVLESSIAAPDSAHLVIEQAASARAHYGGQVSETVSAPPDERGESAQIARLEACGERHEHFFFTSDFLAFLVCLSPRSIFGVEG